MRLNRPIIQYFALLFALLCLFGCGAGGGVSGGVKRLVKPEDFGAAGDGVTDDTLALLRTVASNDDIILTTGKVYLVSGSIPLKPGQKLNGNHAVLKRAAQPAPLVTNTSVQKYASRAIVANSPPTGYRAGMNLVFSQGDQANLVQRVNLTTNFTETRIASVEGNVITLERPPNLTLSGAIDIHNSYATLILDDGSSVYDLTVDGNRDNWSWGRWEVTQEILVIGSHCAVQNCLVQSAPGEGIMVYGTGNVVRDSKITNVNGNGVHLTTCNHALIDNVQVENANSVLALGHQNGCVIASDDVDDTYISHCKLTNGLTGIGSFDYPGNSNNTFTNNSIYNCGAGIDIKKGAINSVVSGNRIYNCGSRQDGIRLKIEGVGGAQVIGNQCYNCGMAIGSDFSADSSAPSGVQCSYNYVENGDIFVGGVNKSSLAQNTLLRGCIDIYQHCDALDVSGNTIDNTASTTLTGILADGSNLSNLLIQGNIITGGDTAVAFGGNLNVANTTIRNNKCNAQRSFGIFCFNNTGVQGGAIQGNQIINSLPGANAWSGIVIKSPLFIIGQNKVSSMDGLTAQNGVRVIASSTVLDGNQLLGLYSDSAIRIYNVCTGVVAQNNIVTKPILDQGTGTVLLNNTIVPP